MSSRRLPSDRDDLAAWISESIDADEAKRVVGRGWKYRILDGASVHKLMTDTPRDAQYHFRVSIEEGVVIARAVARSALNRNAFMRRALAHWLISREGVDPASIPKLAKDL